MVLDAWLYVNYNKHMASLAAQWQWIHLPMQERDLGSIPGWERSPGEMATHSSTLVWEIPWTEEPGGLQSTGLQRDRHDWVTKQQQSDTLGQDRQQESPQIWQFGGCISLKLPLIVNHEFCMAEFWDRIIALWCFNYQTPSERAFCVVACHSWQAQCS